MKIAFDFLNSQLFLIEMQHYIFHCCSNVAERTPLENWSGILEQNGQIPKMCNNPVNWQASD